MSQEENNSSKAGASPQVGMTVSYEDIANPKKTGIITKIFETSGRCFLLFGGSKPMEAIDHEAEVIWVGSWTKSRVAVNSLKEHDYAGWRLYPSPVLTADEVAGIVAEYERMQPILRAERERSEQQKREAKEKEKQRVIAENPGLIRVAENGASGAAVGAKNLKRELAKAFPGVRFSVSSEYYSMGCSINVNWTDGPTSKAVDAIAKKYQYGWFDGSIDLYNYNDDRVWTDVFGGAKYVSCSRDVSEDTVKAVAQAIATDEGITIGDLNANDTKLWERFNGRFSSWREIACHFLSLQDLSGGFKGIEATGCSCGSWPEEFYRMVK